jgi:hypothetical protein
MHELPGFDVDAIAYPMDEFTDVHEDEIWWSKKELHFRRITGMQDFEQQRDAQVFNQEWETVYARILKEVEALYGDRSRGPITTAARIALLEQIMFIRNCTCCRKVMISLKFGALM